MPTSTTPLCLGLVAAMPQEVAALRARIPALRKERAGSLNLFRGDFAGASIVLAESGMGPAHAEEATEQLIRLASPAAILNYGFGGGVVPGLKVGDLVLAERVMMIGKEEATEGPSPAPRLTQVVAGASSPQGKPFKTGTFLTAASIMNKKEVGAAYCSGIDNPVLEMETAAVLRAAARAGVPVVAVRGISDAAEEELGFSLDEFCDADLNLRIPRVLACVAKKPWIIPQLLRLSANTNRAGKLLAEGVERALKVLAEELLEK
ncbi:MTA/SAH nucleosidase [Geomonas sp. Red276]